MPSARPLQETFVKGEGGHRDDHSDFSWYINRSMITTENFGGTSAPADLPTARTNLGLGSSATSNLSSTTPAATAAAGSVGVGTTVARADHVHASPQLTASTPAATAAAGAVGVATDVARSDHVHASPQLSDTVAVALGSASAGVAAASARQDHVHPTTGLLLTSNLSSATPSALASSGSAGSSSDVSKADHAHGMATAWTDYTPTLTNVTLGNGTLVARYCRITPTVMLVNIILTLGSTSSVTGSIGFSLPGGVTAATTVAQRVVSSCFDSSADIAYAGQAAVTSSGINAIRTTGVASTAAATVPFTWATSDNLRLFGAVELA